MTVEIAGFGFGREEHRSAVHIYDVGNTKVYGDVRNRNGMVIDLFNDGPSHPYRRFICWLVQAGSQFDDAGRWALVVDPRRKGDNLDYCYPTAFDAVQAIPLVLPEVWAKVWAVSSKPERPVFEVERFSLYGVEHNTHGLFYDIYATPTHYRHNGRPGDTGFVCWLIYNDDPENSRWALSNRTDKAETKYPYMNQRDALEAIPAMYPEIWREISLLKHA